LEEEVQNSEAAIEETVTEIQRIHSCVDQLIEEQMKDQVCILTNLRILIINVGLKVKTCCM
jgi:hypothetical protein